MTETEKTAWAAGFEAARIAAIGALSLVAPAGEEQQRYQRLLAAAVNAVAAPVGGPNVAEAKQALHVNSRFAALKERLRPETEMPVPPADAPTPTHWADEREPGEDHE